MKKTRLALVFILFVLIFTSLSTDVIAQKPAQVCPPNASVSTLLTHITPDSVAKWIRDFSGANAVSVNGVERTIKTRYSRQLFVNNPEAMAYAYLHQELLNMGYIAGVTLIDHSYNASKYHTISEGFCTVQVDAGAPCEVITDHTGNLEQQFQNASTLLNTDTDLQLFNGFLSVREYAITPEQTAGWKNKVVTIPGHGPNADEIVLMTAHMDSISEKPDTLAPGAEDNGSGVSALMEAARLLRFYKFDRTIKLVFFTGEEQGLWGSKAYVMDHPEEMDDIVGVVNLDMFGYDNDKDMCIELHVGNMPASKNVGTCFTDVNSNYDLGLSYDYLINEAIRASDHASFWDAGVGAIEVLENYDKHSSAYGCGGRKDRNPNYHRTSDLINGMYMPATHATVQAGIGTTASLAGPLGKCFAQDPKITATPQSGSIRLSWPDVEGADVYNNYRSISTCGGNFIQVAQVETNSYEDFDIVFDKYYFYKINAAESGAVCFSQLSNCAVARVPEPIVPVVHEMFLPLIISRE